MDDLPDMYAQSPSLNTNMSVITGFFYMHAWKIQLWLGMVRKIERYSDDR